MRYVFTRRDDLSRQKELIVFVALSVIGLVINELIMHQLLVLSSLHDNDTWQLVLGHTCLEECTKQLDSRSHPIGGRILSMVFSLAPAVASILCIARFARDSLSSCISWLRLSCCVKKAMSSTRFFVQGKRVVLERQMGGRWFDFLCFLRESRYCLRLERCLVPK